MAGPLKSLYSHTCRGKETTPHLEETPKTINPDEERPIRYGFTQPAQKHTPSLELEYFAPNVLKLQRLAT